MKYLIGITLFFVIAGTGCKQKEQPATQESAHADVPVEYGEPDYENLPALKFEFTVRKTGNSLSFKSVQGTNTTVS